MRCKLKLRLIGSMVARQLVVEILVTAVFIHAQVAWIHQRNRGF
ncbi:Uncharacterised protein [Vibrio cholerae]|nr:Uncharacterised protein [Vibrio cholerae]